MAEILSWVHPFSCMISGPTGSGKTVFTHRLLTSDLISPKPQRTLWLYGQYQSLFDTLREQLPQLEFVNGAPQALLESLCKQTNEPTLVVVDDLMDQMANDKAMTKLFVQGSHHCNLSICFLVQNAFFKGKEMRTISLNCQIMVLFKSVRDKSQIGYLAQQMYGPKSRLLQDAYADATARPFGYLVVNLTPRRDDRHRLMTNVFPEEYPAVVYAPKSF